MITYVLAQAGKDIVMPPAARHKDAGWIENIRRDAHNFVSSEYCRWMCEELHINWNEVRKHPERLAEMERRIMEASA